MIRQNLGKVSPSAAAQFDHILVGGGLQNGLIALLLLREQPDARICLVEQGDRLGGNHTWCFHGTDIPTERRGALEPLIVRSWDGHDVAFPSFERTLPGSYHAVSSERFDSVLRGMFDASPRARLLLNARVERVGPHEVALEDGQVLTAAAVIDGRGPDARADLPGTAYQKFLGLELQLSAPAGRQRPMLMDARVPQTDGYRFFYVLPLAERRVLIEDTYFSDTPDIDAGALREEILTYAMRHGYEVEGIIREESGVLPLPLEMDGEIGEGLPLRSGMLGGFFNPVTGYSFPVAFRLAEHVASRAPSELFDAGWHDMVAALRGQQKYLLLLNRMLFRAFAPEHRRNVFERFYRLPDPLIQRFYSMELSAADRARILVGRPPRGFSLRRALAQGYKP